MYLTAEVRWFGRERADQNLSRWAHRLPGRPEEYPTRVDRYLRLGSDDSLGIKLREGRIEVKQRQQQLGVSRFCPRVEGILEIWSKWSFILATDEPFPITPEPSWIEVSKTRLLWRYRLTQGGDLETVPFGQLADQGCSLETTQITAAGGSWWSLGLEAHGDESVVVEILRQVAAILFSVAEPPELDQSISYAYPRWLAQMPV